MHARSLTPRRGVVLRPASIDVLVFLRGKDADGRLREVSAQRRALRPLLGALAGPMAERRLYEKLGYRTLDDYARERLGVEGRTLREWARVARALEELPLLRDAVHTGQVSWAVAREVAALASPETEAACLETVWGRTLRAVKEIVRAFRAATAAPAVAVEPAGVLVRAPCSAREAELWYAAVELARRLAGEELPVWACAEAMAAEVAGALGIGSEPGADAGAEGASRHSFAEHVPARREEAYPNVPWRAARSASLPPELASLGEGSGAASPRDLDRRLRAAIASLQSVDLETGRILRQMEDRKLFGEIGFSGLADYARERLDCSPRTARRLVALARTEHRAPAVASAFRDGSVRTLQAEALARVATCSDAEVWVERAREVTLRRLSDEVDAALSASGRRRAIAFRAPAGVAALFRQVLARAGSLARMLGHVILTWVQQGEPFRDYADFVRDGYRCGVPGCHARRNLQSHHVVFRSRGGADESWNRLTLCAFHHQRAIHQEGTLAISGRAPDALVFRLGVGQGVHAAGGGPEVFRSGDRRVAT